MKRDQSKHEELNRKFGIQSNALKQQLLYDRFSSGALPFSSANEIQIHENELATDVTFNVSFQHLLDNDLYLENVFYEKLTSDETSQYFSIARVDNPSDLSSKDKAVVLNTNSDLVLGYSDDDAKFLALAPKKESFFHDKYGNSVDSPEEYDFATMYARRKLLKPDRNTIYVQVPELDTEVSFVKLDELTNLTGINSTFDLPVEALRVGLNDVCENLFHNKIVTAYTGSTWDLIRQCTYLAATEAGFKGIKENGTQVNLEFTNTASLTKYLFCGFYPINGDPTLIFVAEEPTSKKTRVFYASLSAYTPIFEDNSVMEMGCAYLDGVTSEITGIWNIIEYDDVSLMLPKDGGFLQFSDFKYGFPKTQRFIPESKISVQSPGFGINEDAKLDMPFTASGERYSIDTMTVGDKDLSGSVDLSNQAIYWKVNGLALEGMSAVNEDTFSWTLLTDLSGATNDDIVAVSDKVLLMKSETEEGSFLYGFMSGIKPYVFNPEWGWAVVSNDGGETKYRLHDLFVKHGCSMIGKCPDLLQDFLCLSESTAETAVKSTPAWAVLVDAFRAYTLTKTETMLYSLKPGKKNEVQFKNAVGGVQGNIYDFRAQLAKESFSPTSGSVDWYDNSASKNVILNSLSTEVDMGLESLIQQSTLNGLVDLCKKDASDRYIPISKVNLTESDVSFVNLLTDADVRTAIGDQFKTVRAGISSQYSKPNEDITIGWDGRQNGIIVNLASSSLFEDYIYDIYSSASSGFGDWSMHPTSWVCPQGDPEGAWDSDTEHHIWNNFLAAYKWFGGDPDVADHLTTLDYYRIKYKDLKNELEVLPDEYDWRKNPEYVVGDLVMYEGHVYRYDDSEHEWHTGAFDSDKWKLVDHVSDEGIDYNIGKRTINIGTVETGSYTDAQYGSRNYVSTSTGPHFLFKGDDDSWIEDSDIDDPDNPVVTSYDMCDIITNNRIVYGINGDALPNVTKLYVVNGEFSTTAQIEIQEQASGETVTEIKDLGKLTIRFRKNEYGEFELTKSDETGSGTLTQDTQSGVWNHEPTSGSVEYVEFKPASNVIVQAGNYDWRMGPKKDTSTSPDWPRGFCLRGIKVTSDNVDYWISCKIPYFYGEAQLTANILSQLSVGELLSYCSDLSTWFIQRKLMKLTTNEIGNLVSIKDWFYDDVRFGTKTMDWLIEHSGRRDDADGWMDRNGCALESLKIDGSYPEKAPPETDYVFTQAGNASQNDKFNSNNLKGTFTITTEMFYYLANSSTYTIDRYTYKLVHSFEFTYTIERQANISGADYKAIDDSITANITNTPSGVVTKETGDKPFIGTPTEWSISYSWSGGKANAKSNLEKLLKYLYKFEKNGDQPTLLEDPNDADFPHVIDYVTENDPVVPQGMDPAFYSPSIRTGASEITFSVAPTQVSFFTKLADCCKKYMFSNTHPMSVNSAKFIAKTDTVIRNIDNNYKDFNGHLNDSLVPDILYATPEAVIAQDVLVNRGFGFNVSSDLWQLMVNRMKTFSTNLVDEYGEVADDHAFDSDALFKDIYSGLSQSDRFSGMHSRVNDLALGILNGVAGKSYVKYTVLENEIPDRLFHVKNGTHTSEFVGLSDRKILLYRENDLISDINRNRLTTTSIPLSALPYDVKVLPFNLNEYKTFNSSSTSSSTLVYWTDAEPGNAYGLNEDFNPYPFVDDGNMRGLFKFIDGKNTQRKIVSLVYSPSLGNILVAVMGSADIYCFPMRGLTYENDGVYVLREGINCKVYKTLHSGNVSGIDIAAMYLSDRNETTCSTDDFDGTYSLLVNFNSPNKNLQQFQFTQKMEDEPYCKVCPSNVFEDENLTAAYRQFSEDVVYDIAKTDEGLVIITDAGLTRFENGYAERLDNTVYPTVKRLFPTADSMYESYYLDGNLVLNCISTSENLAELYPYTTIDLSQLIPGLKDDMKGLIVYDVDMTSWSSTSSISYIVVYTNKGIYLLDMGMTPSLLKYEERSEILDFFKERAKKGLKAHLDSRHNEKTILGRFNNWRRRISENTIYDFAALTTNVAYTSPTEMHGNHCDNENIAVKVAKQSFIAGSLLSSAEENPGVVFAAVSSPISKLDTRWEKAQLASPLVDTQFYDYFYKKETAPNGSQLIKNILNLNHLPFIYRHNTDGTWDMWINVPSTMTPYMNRIVGTTMNIKGGRVKVEGNVASMRKNLNSMALIADPAEQATKLRLYVNLAHFHADTIREAIISGCSLPMHTYRDTNANDGLFDGVQLQSVWNGKVQTVTDKHGVAYAMLEFDVWGSDEQSIRLHGDTAKKEKA